MKNKFKVQKKQWTKWSEQARVVFNKTYEVMGDQQLFSHPKSIPQKPECWKTTRWNAAWIAADAVDGLI